MAKKSMKPKPDDLTLYNCTVLLRKVPSVDNLLEVAVYLNRNNFMAAAKHLEGLEDLESAEGEIIRRGQKNKATNIFIYG